MQNRIKKNVSAPVPTRAQVETLIGHIRGEKIRELRIQADREKQLKEVDEKFRADLNSISAAIQDKFAQVQSWAEANAEEFVMRKSLEFTHGTIGFRTGTPRLALLNRQWTWEKVLAALRRVPLWQKFIRTREEVDKDRLIAERELVAGVLPDFGVKVVQDESFFIEPKIEEVETRQSDKP